MKQFFFLPVILFLNLTCIAQSQTYIPMVIEGTHWIVGGTVQMDPIPYTHLSEFFIQGDTLVNGITYKKVIKRELETVNNTFHSGPYQPTSIYFQMVALLREDTISRKVFAIKLKTSSGQPYVYENCPDTEFTMYDFAMSKGDTLLPCTADNDTVTVDTILRKANPYSFGPTLIQAFDSLTFFFLSNGIQIVEAFGDAQGPFHSHTFAIGIGSRLVNYCRGNSCDSMIVPNPTLSVMEDFERNNWIIYPNPTKKHLIIKYGGSDNSFANIRMFDFTGKEVLPRTKHFLSDKEIKKDLSQVPTGIYFLEIFTRNHFVRKKIRIEKE